MTKKHARKSDLAANAAELKAIDSALTRMHIEYGNDADSRQDYLKLAARRRERVRFNGEHSNKPITPITIMIRRRMRKSSMKKCYQETELLV